MIGQACAQQEWPGWLAIPLLPLLLPLPLLLMQLPLHRTWAPQM